MNAVIDLSFSLQLIQFLSQLRNCLKQIGFEAVVGYLENRLIGFYFIIYLLVLMATITLESFIPAKCCTAPEMPTAT